MDGGTAPLSAAVADYRHLSESRPLRWDRIAGSAAARALVDQVLSELIEGETGRARARREADLLRLRRVLEAVLMDLIVVAGEEPGRYLAYPRRREEFSTARKRYQLPEATLTAVVTVAGFLEREGYVVSKRGGFSRTDWGSGVTTGKGFRSRMRPTSKFRARAALSGVSAADIALSGSMELIRLKGPVTGGRKELVGYTDTDQTVRWRGSLVQWANVANAHVIRLHNGEAAPGVAPAHDEGDGAGELVERSRCQLYRVFNDGRFDRGGRFYGGWWMALPKSARARITINGRPVVELDFKAFYPRLCYDLEGQSLDPDEDPYALPALHQAVDRSVLKVALNQLIAVGPEGTPRKPPNATLPRGLSYKALLSAMEERHAPIKPWLRAARALELQRIDSEIADRVLAYMTRRQRPVLPVHDSFVVAVEDEGALAGAMLSSYQAVVMDVVGHRATAVIDRSVPGAL